MYWFYGYGIVGMVYFVLYQSVASQAQRKEWNSSGILARLTTIAAFVTVWPVFLLLSNYKGR